jgi:hypothetical protein
LSELILSLVTQNEQGVLCWLEGEKGQQRHSDEGSFSHVVDQKMNWAERLRHWDDGKNLDCLSLSCCLLSSAHDLCALLNRRNEAESDSNCWELVEWRTMFWGEGVRQRWEEDEETVDDEAEMANCRWGERSEWGYAGGGLLLQILDRRERSGRDRETDRERQRGREGGDVLTKVVSLLLRDQRCPIGLVKESSLSEWASSRETRLLPWKEQSAVLEPETERSREDLVTRESEDGSTDRTAEPETSQHVAAVHTIGRESRWEESASQGRELREFKLPQLTERETARQRQRERVRETIRQRMR